MTTDTTEPVAADVTSDIAIITTGTPEDIVTIRMHRKARMQRAREELALIDDAILSHIEANGGAPIVVGTVELRATYPKDTRNRDGAKGRTLAALFGATGGDMDAVAGLLCSDPYKPGACRGVLPGEAFADCFETVSKPRLVEGVAKKSLVEVDTRFLPGRE